MLVVAALALGMTAPPGAVSVAVDIGGGRSMTLFRPAENIEAQNAAVAAILGVDVDVVSEQRGAMAFADNAEGQKLWPASVSFSKMLSAQRTLVEDCDVIELGCGLGGVGIAAALLGARSVVLTDFQPKSLELAAAAAEANGVGDRVTTRLLDWSKPLDDDLGPFDVVLGSDILYSKDVVGDLFDVIAAMLVGSGPRDRSRPEPRALLVDAPMRPCRSMLPELCAARGLFWGGELPVAESDVPNTVLINVLRG